MKLKNRIRDILKKDFLLRIVRIEKDNIVFTEYILDPLSNFFFKGGLFQNYL